jgi:hypothetical protein
LPLRKPEKPPQEIPRKPAETRSAPLQAIENPIAQDTPKTTTETSPVDQETTRPSVGPATPGTPSTQSGTALGKPAPPAREVSPHDPDLEYAKTLAEDYPYDGVLFLDVDLYVLHAPHSNIGIPVPGTQVCIEGDQLRAKEPLKLTDVKTDWGTCKIDRISDETELLICPDSAHTTKVLFDGYLSSPITYGVNTCLEYDSSHCYLKNPGTFSQLEICRVDFKYEGIWAEGTIFDYKCTRSETRVYRHPLEYTIRYMQDVEDILNNRMRHKPRLLHKVTRPIPKCK